MRVAFVTQPGHAVLPATGSIELWTHSVVRGLSKRHNVTIYASGYGPATGREDGGVTYRFVPHQHGDTVRRALRAARRLSPPTRPFFASRLHPLEYWLRIALDVRRRRCDVVHVVNYSQALPILRRLTGAKLVLHMHCEWLSQLDARMIDQRLRHADLVLGCSDYITDKIRDRFPQHAARCKTVYNGVDLGAYAASPATVGETVELLHVGRVSPEKGLHVLVHALDIVVRKHPEVRLTILGEESPVPYEFAVAISSDDLVKDLARFYGGSYLAELRRQMSPAVAERVRFIDRIPHDETRAYYERADIFVFPSIFEAFPIPPLEAMAAGLPVIASRAGGVVESVRHRTTGILVERGDAVGLADAILELVGDAALRRSLGAAGKARAAELYAWPKIVADFESALAAVTGRTSIPPVLPEEAVALD